MNPTFSTHWLIPNLREFNKINPDIIVNIHSLANIGDFLNREYDAAIMREDFCSPWSEVEYLFEEEILPVCSGSLLPQPNQKLTVEELLNEFPPFASKYAPSKAGRNGSRCRISTVRW
ncbi:LysR family transcriptional regulator [Citrobacter koseri]|uniref:LysR family transcriptional regulator n=1 Tax=Citrobacter koseri TaxID=545 RepID=A0A2X2UWF1_CITKO|nr:LysR family transcriptional regulator [Citrobacter koseri]